MTTRPPLRCAQARLARAAGTLLAAMAWWLGWAYLLEFRGLPVHLGVWAAGLLFLAAHTWLACELVRAARPCAKAKSA